MANLECVDELLAPDSDEESIEFIDEEFHNLLDVGEGSETGDGIPSSDNLNFFLDEELDYEPGDDDHDLIVDVTAEDMFEDDCDDNIPEEENKVSIQSVRASLPKQNIVINNSHDAANGDITPTVKVFTKVTVPTNTLPDTSHTPLPSFLTRVRDRLSSPSPAMVCWHRCHLMKEVARGLDMTTSIITWHRFHAWSIKNTRKTISDKIKELETVLEIEEENVVGDRSEGGGGKLSDRFGVLAQKTQERMSGKRKGDELGQVRNKIMKKLCSGDMVMGGRKERFGEVDQNCFDNVKFLSDKWRF